MLKLKLMREHFTSKPGGVWVPKKAFKTIEEIEELGFDLSLCNIYRCSFCNFLHQSTYPSTKHKNVVT